MNSAASREIEKQPSFLSLGDILWAFPFTPVNNAWLGCRFRQVPLLKVQAQLLIRHRGPRECIMDLTTELPQTVRQRARRFMSKSTLISEGKLNRMLFASFDAVILPLSVQLRHLWEWSATLIKDEDKGKVSLWEERFQSQTSIAKLNTRWSEWGYTEF